MDASRNADPLVSICIPVYNSGTTIGRTLDSVIGQTYRNLEIIVVDNLSTDGTLDRVREFNDPRIRIVENPVHFHCAEDNWNTCFAHAHGEFIALFHADDMYSPETVARQVAMFRKNPSVMGVFTQGNVIDEGDTIIDTFRLPPEITGDIPYSYCEILPVVLEHGNIFLCPSAMIRAEAYKETAPFRYDQFGSASDFDMWLRIARGGPVVIIDDKLLKYRMSRTQWSFGLRARTQLADGFRVLDFHTARYGAECKLSDNILGRYELRRMEDQIFCLLNFLKKHDFPGFRNHVAGMPWRKYLGIIIRKPRMSLAVLVRGIGKLPKNFRQ